MDMASIKEREDALFDIWGKQRPRMIRDGVIDEDIYRKVDPKIVYVLDEPQQDATRYTDLRSHLKEGGNSCAWADIARWTYGVRNLDKDLGWGEIDEDDFEHLEFGLPRPLQIECLRGAAVMCISKVSHENDEDAFYITAMEDGGYLREQFDIYAPDLAILCGEWVANAFGKKHSRCSRGELSRYGVFSW